MWGKVYFGGDVYITVKTLLTSQRTKLFSAGDVYFFNGVKSVDLVKYFFDTRDPGKLFD
jgi:hypothetical protein